MFPAVISPVKLEAPVTDNCPKVALSEVRVVISQLVASKLVIVASVEFKVVIVQVVAVNQSVVVSQVTDKSQATDKSEPVVTVQLRVEVQATVKFHPTDAFQEVSNVAVLTSEASILVAFKAVIFPVVASIVSAVTVVHMNVPFAVMLPVKVTSPSTVHKVNSTLDKSKLSRHSIMLCKTSVSSDTLYILESSILTTIGAVPNTS